MKLIKPLLYLIKPLPKERACFILGLQVFSPVYVRNRAFLGLVFCFVGLVFLISSLKACVFCGFP